MKLKEALDIKPGEVISLVGGGGKTTLMFALAQEIASSGKSVVSTTTTRILEPLPSETPLLLLETDEKRLIEMFLRNIDKYRHVTLASERLPQEKLRGVSPDLVVKLAESGGAAYIIVEADGAAGRSLKAPNPTEPVIPFNTSLVIPVVGIDAVGCRLTEEKVFRAEIAARLLGLPLGAVISAEAVALLLTHPQGIIKGSPAQARIVPFLNKMDLDGALARGRDLADKILAAGHPQIKEVVLGQVESPEPAVEVIARVNQRRP